MINPVLTFEFSLLTLKTINVSHNDIKPSTFLLKWPKNQTPSVDNLEVYLPESGFANQQGGYTPLFGSPECLTEPDVKKSDTFCLGRTFLFILSEDREMYYKLLMCPIQSRQKQKNAERIFEQIPLLKLIKEMTKTRVADRIELERVETLLFSLSGTQIDIITEDFLKRKKFPIKIFKEFGSNPFPIDQMLAES